jgi:hypothetical protein
MYSYPFTKKAKDYMTKSHEQLNEVLANAGVSKTIYSLVMPETERIVDGIVGDAGSRLREEFHSSYREAWTQKQDAAHEVFFDTWKNWNSLVVKTDWAQFPFMYPINGASEGLREAIHDFGAKSRVSGFKPTIHVFIGEYEGFSAYAAAAGIPVRVHSRKNWQASLTQVGPHDQFYLSHPSAIDGNIWQDYDSFARALHEIQPTAKLMLDLTYVGCVAKAFQVKADYPNIESIFFSLSKPAGAYYHRIGGMLSRTEYPGLFGNKWFKNLLALRVGTEFMKAHGVHELPTKYAAVQAEAISKANQALGLQLMPSDVFLLGTMAPCANQTDLERYLTRGSPGEALVRVCLTPTMAHIIDPKLNPTVRARPHEELPEMTP